MVNKGVVFVAGHLCSSSSIPASDVYHEENILQISPGSTTPQLTERGLGNVFRICGRDDQQGVVAGRFIARRYADRRVAIVHDKSAYGKGLADVVIETMNRAGLQEVLHEAITAGEKDYSALVSKMKAQQVEAVYFGGYQNEAGLIVRQMHAQGLDARMISADSLMSSKQYRDITGDAGEGTVITFSVDPRKNPDAADVVAEYRAQGIEPEAFTLYTYAAFQVWAQAAERAGSVETDKVAARLRSDRFATVLGELTFDAKGDIEAPLYVLYELKDGKYDYF